MDSPVDGCVFCAIVAGRAPGAWPGCCGRAPNPAGVNLVHATGEAAWQNMFHFHVHAVPRYRPDELQLMWREAPADGADLAAVARGCWPATIDPATAWPRRT